MIGRTIIAVVACAGLLALSAPVASGDVVNAVARVCTGTAEWKVNLAGAYADVFVTSSTCKRAEASVDDNGNPHLNGSDVPFSGGYRIGLLGVTVTGTNSFVGTAFGEFAGTGNGDFGGGPVQVVSPGILNATLSGSNTSQPATAVAEHVGIESCGTNCYRTQVRWVHANDGLP